MHEYTATKREGAGRRLRKRRQHHPRVVAAMTEHKPRSPHIGMERAVEAAPQQPAPQRPPQNCIVCKEEFTGRPNRRLCFSEACHRKRLAFLNRRSCERRGLRGNWKHIRECIECGAEFMPFHFNEKTCSHACRCDRIARQKRDISREFVRRILRERGPRYEQMLVSKNRYARSDKRKRTRKKSDEKYIEKLKREYPEKYERWREQVREGSRIHTARVTLMRQLSGAALPRPGCSNNCQGPHYLPGWKTRAPHKKRYCRTCVVLLNDAECSCCRHNSTPLYNQALRKRRMWKATEQAIANEDAMWMLIRGRANGRCLPLAPGEEQRGTHREPVPVPESMALTRLSARLKMAKRHVECLEALDALAVHA